MNGFGLFLGAGLAPSGAAAPSRLEPLNRPLEPLNQPTDGERSDFGNGSEPWFRTLNWTKRESPQHEHRKLYRSLYCFLILKGLSLNGEQCDRVTNSDRPSFLYAIGRVELAVSHCHCVKNCVDAGCDSQCKSDYNHSALKSWRRSTPGRWQGAVFVVHGHYLKKLQSSSSDIDECSFTDIPDGSLVGISKNVYALW